MIRNSITLGGLLLTTGFAGAAIALEGGYDDARLNWTVAETSGMRVDYPAGVFTVDLGPSDKGPGRVCLGVLPAMGASRGPDHSLSEVPSNVSWVTFAYLAAP